MGGTEVDNKALAQENERLKNENRRLKLLLHKIKDIVNENE